MNLKDCYDKYLNSKFSITEECIENALIYHLINKLNYTYREDIKDSLQLKQNFREKYEKLNSYKFDDKEFEMFWTTFDSGDIFKRFETLQKDLYEPKDKNGKVIKQLKFFDYENIENNSFEIVNQLWTKNKNNENNRFDINLLINGIPIIHIELKREKGTLEDACKQIISYKEIEAISKFFNFTKLFIYSNGTSTRYFVNNPQNFEKYQNLSFEWADKNNEKINELLEFSKNFLNKEFLLDFIKNYFVIDKKKNDIKVFRSYQYHASNEIIKRIKNNQLTNKQKSGYVWHSTGSGKTMTSFKVCEILSNLKDVDLTVFLIDRQDLNTQTVDVFQGFSDNKNLVHNATDTNDLIDLMLSKNSNRRIIISTIQKLNNAIRDIDKSRLKSISDKKIVFMVDEGHRSQVGEMRKNIDKFFTNSINIAFTGTPIFDQNSLDGKTTQNIFGEEIHRYTTYEAIKDKNVTDFVFNFTQSIKSNFDSSTNVYQDELDDELEGNEYIEVDQGKIDAVVDYIDQHYDEYTRNKKFNAMLACSTILEAISYYETFKKNTQLKCAIVYTSNKSDYTKNREISLKSYNFLLKIIQEYNETWDITSLNKYKSSIQSDFSNENKRKYDLLIVVSMLLTGFDSPITNTLFLDKQLHYQSLIQAISRTNRIYPGKESGYIVSFKTSKEDAKKAFALYTTGGSNTPLGKWKIFEYKDLKEEFDKAIDSLFEKFPSPEMVSKISTQEEELCYDFINKFKEVMRAFNKIKPCPEFNWNNFKLTQRDFDKFKGEFNRIGETSQNINVIYVYNDYQIVDLERVEFNVDYLKKLLDDFLKKPFNNEIDFEKFTKEKVQKATSEEDKEILVGFLKYERFKNIKTFDDVIKAWNTYILNLIESTKEKAILNWKTTKKTIDDLIKELKIKNNRLDAEYIEDALPDYIVDGYLDDKYEFKINDVNKIVRKIRTLEEMSDLRII